MRMFAKPAPHTMTREWQEASNEYLKVRRISVLPKNNSSMLTWAKNTGAESRPFHRYRFARLQGPGTGSVAAREGLRRSGNGWKRCSPLSVAEAETKMAGRATILSLPHGLTSMYEMMSRERESIGLAACLDVVISYVDVNMCTRIPRSFNSTGVASSRLQLARGRPLCSSGLQIDPTGLFRSPKGLCRTSTRSTTRGSVVKIH